MSEAFVTFREGLEAALVVGIFARYVPDKQRFWLWSGILSAVAISGIAAIIFAHLSTLHQIWEVLFSAAAAGMLLYMVIWMRRRSVSLSHELREAAQTSTGWLLFGIAFTTVLREGLETALFLRTLWAMQEKLSWSGALMGLLVAVGIGALIFIYGRRIPLRPFFNATSILLLLIAAGMAAYATHELLELLEDRAAWAHELAERKAWNLFAPLTTPPVENQWLYVAHEGKYYPPLHHKGWIGALLHVLTGWRANMTWIELLVWIGTFGGGFWLWYKASPPASPSKK